jgi:hypothetical protein
MAISIPSTVFTKYKEFADAMIADFGVNCKLVYTEQVEEISEDVPRVKQRRSMNIQDRNDAAGFARGSKKFKTVENTEDIKLRVYWNRKDWVKVGEIDIPDDAIQTIGYLSDFTSINKAKALIVNSDIDGYREYRFIKASEPFPWGFKQDRYMVCFWTRE